MTGPSARVVALGTDTHETNPDLWDDDVKRRAALQILAAVTAVTAVTAGTAIPPHALKIVLSGIDDVLDDSLDLDEWQATIHEYARTMDSSPAGVLVPDLTSDIVVVGELLKRHKGGSNEAGLLRVSAGLSCLLADTLDETGRRRAARAAWRTARRAADASGDRDMSVWVRAREAQIARYTERPDDDVTELVSESFHYAHGVPSAGLARAHAAHATMAAANGDVETVRTELAAASDLVGHVTGGWAEKNFGWLDAYVRTMTNAPSAGARIDEAIALFPSRTLGAVTSLHLMKALNLVATREIDEGLHYAITTLEERGPTGHMRDLLTRRILTELPPRAQALPAARDLQALATEA